MRNIFITPFKDFRKKNTLPKGYDLEYFNNSKYFNSKVICVFLVKFGFYPDTKKTAENGHFLQLRGFWTALIS